MKHCISIGLSIVLLFLCLSGCSKDPASKPSPTMEGEIDKKIEEKKVVFTKPIKTINDFIIKKIALEYPQNIEQVVNSLPLEQLQNITEINILEKGSFLKSLRGIERLQNLDYICIQHSQIWTIGDVKISEKIKYLFLGNCQISETSSLENLEQINSLGLYGCPIKELGDFSKLKNLRNLSLDDTSIGKLDGEKLPHSLRYLGLRQTKFKSLKAIESTFPFVEIIDLSHGAIESVEDVQDFGHVQQIGLVGTPVMEKFRDKDGKVPQSVDYKGVTLIFVEPDF